MKQSHIAVFDLDKTIISNDSTYHFIKELIEISIWRKALVTLVTPIILFCFMRPASWKIAVSIYLYIATVGRTKKSFFERTDRFGKQYFKKPLKGYAYAKALKQISKHQAMGHDILIVTGSLELIATPIVKQLGIDPVTIIGSKIKWLAGGWIVSDYCLHENKVIMAQNINLGTTQWDYGYSDSAHDLPFLKLCKKKYFINPSKKTLKMAKQALGNDFTVLYW